MCIMIQNDLSFFSYKLKYWNFLEHKNYCNYHCWSFCYRKKLNVNITSPTHCLYIGNCTFMLSKYSP